MNQLKKTCVKKGSY